MKHVIVGLVCLVLGVLLTKSFIPNGKLELTSQVNEPTSTGSLLSNDVFDRLTNEITSNKEEIKALRTDIDKIMQVILEHESYHGKSELTETGVNLNGSPEVDKLSRQEQQNFENHQRFEAELSRYSEMPSGSTEAYELEAQIQDLLLSSENNAPINYDSLECKANACSISLNQVKFRTDFEKLMFKVLELPQLKDNHVFIDPLPMTNEPLNYRIIINTPGAMN